MTIIDAKLSRTRSNLARTITSFRVEYKTVIIYIKMNNCQRHCFNVGNITDRSLSSIIQKKLIAMRIFLKFAKNSMAKNV